jgi:hypothetical protein
MLLTMATTTTWLHWIMTDKSKKNLVHYYPNSIYVLPNGHVTKKKRKDTMTMATTTTWLHWIITDKPKKNLVHYYPNSIYVLPNGRVTNAKTSKDTYGGKNTSFDDRTENGPTFNHSWIPTHCPFFFGFFLGFRNKLPGTGKHVELIVRLFFDLSDGQFED